MDGMNVRDRERKRGIVGDILSLGVDVGFYYIACSNNNISCWLKQCMNYAVGGSSRSVVHRWICPHCRNLSTVVS
jgi:hypothetical protein